MQNLQQFRLKAIGIERLDRTLAVVGAARDLALASRAYQHSLNLLNVGLAGPHPALAKTALERYPEKRMIAPMAKLLDWLAIQLVWGVRVNSLLKLQTPAASPKLEEALQFLNGPDFIPV